MARAMIAYLVRHGVAHPDRGGGDFDRALTDEGIHRMRRIAAGLRQTMKVRPAAIWSSPLKRTVQTAELICEALELPDLMLCDWLAPDGDPEAHSTALRSMPEAVVLVGHQPGLGALASRMLTGTADSAFLPFKKGAAACIQRSGSDLHGQLQWFMTPAQLARIGR